jgi:hypothetical protein
VESLVLYFSYYLNLGHANIIPACLYKFKFINSMFNLILTLKSKLIVILKNTTTNKNGLRIFRDGYIGKIVILLT